MRLLRLLIVLLAGCGSTSPILPVGSVPLVAFNGQPLPAHASQLPSGDGSPSPCSLQYVSGQLTLDEEANSYAIEYSGRDSCTGRALSTQSGGGTFKRRGSRLWFTPRSGSSYDGEIVNDQLVLRAQGGAFVFQLR